MKARFVSQPDLSGFDLRDYLEETCRDPEIERLDLVVAWARRSGLRVIDPALRKFRSEGGEVRFVVGIDEGGATRQGLELVIELSDAAYVFHDVRGRTFHPKIYLGRGTRRATCLVGSHNVTRGGTVENHEAGVVVDLDLSESADLAFADEMSRYVDRLVGDRACCTRLEGASLALMAGSPRLLVGDEDHPVHRGPPYGDGGGGVRLDPFAGTGLPFARSSRRVRSAPASAIGRGKVTGAPGGAGRPAAGTKAQVVKRWSKRLDRANAQRPEAGTNPTGHLSLTQAGHPIDHRRYFREELFATAAWSAGASRTGKPLELARVPFLVEIRRVAASKDVLTIEHRPALVAGQGNRATVLRWGTRLMTHFRAVDHVGDFVTLEALSDGTFRLLIDAAPGGPFLA